MPNTKTQQYVLIRTYHHGRDGHVYLASSMSRNLVVLKFLNIMRTGKTEANIWRDVWKCKFAKAIKLYGFDVIVMPFVFHYRKSVDGRHLGFMPAHQWTSLEPITSASSLLESKEIKDNENFNLENIDRFVKDPKMALEIALKELARHKIVHKDIEWRHLALLPFKKDKFGEWYVRPVMIDLSDTKKVESEDIAWNEMEEIHSLLLSELP
jgi:hypothetical protein